VRTGHLFAGIDGIGLGLEPHGFEPAWFSEYEDAPSRVLAHHYPDVPNHGDITAIDWTRVEPVDVLTGGYPCQPFSYAGSRGGDTDVRHLWPFYRDAIRHLRPRLALLENVPGHRSLGFGRVLGDLAEAGYDCRWTSLRASDVGAAHRRERVFIVATATDTSLDRRPSWGTGTGKRARSTGLVASHPEAVAYLDGGGRIQRGEQDGGTVRPRLEAPRRGDARRRDPASTYTNGEREQVSATGQHAAVQLPRSDGAHWTAWGEFAPAIDRWEHVTGRRAPDPTVDGRLSADFTEWHMGFPPGWTSMLSRNERLKALGNAVVPQCSDVIGRWALDLVEREVAA